MNFCGYEPTDLVNGDGVRTTLWVSGCSHHCAGCFNQKSWSYSYGNPFSDEDLSRVLADMGRPFIRGLSILGGEPLDPYNINGVTKVIDRVREEFGDSKSIMVWTGYLFEDVDISIKKKVDIIMDGKYDKDKPTNKIFRGSDNQRMWVKIDGEWEVR